MKEHLQPHGQEGTTKRKWTAEDRAVFGLTLAGGAGVAEMLNLIAHGGWGGAAFAAAAAAIIAKSSPDIYAGMKDYLPWAELQHSVSEIVNHREPGSRSLADRLMGHHSDEQSTISLEPGHADAETGEWNEAWYDHDESDDVALPVGSKNYLFSHVLDEGFTPSLTKIFLGRLADGTPIEVPAKDLCHVALAGSTGNGKSSIMRLIMAQLCKARVRVLLLNPHYMRYDQSGGEDWTPFEPYLEKPPIDCASYEAIGDCLRWMSETLLKKRIERARQGQAIGKPFFVVIDELPAIVGEIKDAPMHIAKLLREGRKYGIYLIVASQDFLVKTTGMDGGGVRKCFRTAFYVGGDMSTARVLLEQGSVVPETDLGKGTIMLRCSATKQAVLAQVPYVDNAALYRLLGPSHFERSGDVVQGADEDDEREGSGHHTRSVEQGEQSSPLTLDALVQLLLTDKIDEDMFKRLLDSLHITDSDVSRPVPSQPVTPAFLSSETPNVRSVGRENGTGRDGEEDPENEREKPVPTFPDIVPNLGPDDKAFTPAQAQDFLRRYRRAPDIRTCLGQMVNNRGEIGMGSRYYKHAKWLVEQDKRHHAEGEN